MLARPAGAAAEQIPADQAASSESGDAVDICALVTEILVALLQRGARSLRDMVRRVFRDLCTYASAAAVDVLANVALGEDTRGTTGAEASDDDEEEGEDGGGESASDGEGSAGSDSDDDDDDDDDVHDAESDGDGESIDKGAGGSPADSEKEEAEPQGSEGEEGSDEAEGKGAGGGKHRVHKRARAEGASENSEGEDEGEGEHAGVGADGVGEADFGADGLPACHSASRARSFLALAAEDRRQRH